MFARAVKLVGPVTVSEARLLALVSLTIVGLIFISTLVNPPQWLQLVALFVHLISLVVGFGSVLAVDWYGLLSLSRRVTIGDVLLTAERMTPDLDRPRRSHRQRRIAQAKSEFLAGRQALLCAWRGNRRRTRPGDEPPHGTSDADSLTVADPPRHGARRCLTGVLVDCCRHWLRDQRRLDMIAVVCGRA
jgi:hypothetical protein